MADEPRGLIDRLFGPRRDTREKLYAEPGVWIDGGAIEGEHHDGVAGQPRYLERIDPGSPPEDLDPAAARYDIVFHNSVPLGFRMGLAIAGLIVMLVSVAAMIGGYPEPFLTLLAGVLVVVVGMGIGQDSFTFRPSAAGRWVHVPDAHPPEPADAPGQPGWGYAVFLGVFVVGLIARAIANPSISLLHRVVDLAMAAGFGATAILHAREVISARQQADESRFLELADPTVPLPESVIPAPRAENDER